MSYLGTNKIGKMYLGSTEIAKAYLGSDLVYKKQSSLPYDAEIEYLESTGTQYINLGITPQANEVVKVRFSNYQGASFAVFIGSRYSVGNRQCYLGYYNGNFVASLGSQNSTAIATADNGYHEISLNTANGLASIDGNPGVSAGSYVTSSFDLCLFALNTNGSIGNESKVKIKEVEVGTRIHLIPVRKGTIGYMYDKVSGQLFGNSGTDSFILGPPLPYDAEVEYLQSSGTQYINLGIQPSSDDIVTIDF